MFLTPVRASPNSRATPPLYPLSWPLFSLGRHSHEKMQQKPSVPLSNVTLNSRGPEWLSHIKSDPTCQSFEHSSLYHNQLRIPKVILSSCPQNTKINTCSNTFISSVSSRIGQPHIFGYGLFYKALELGMAFTTLKRYGNKNVWQRPGPAKA